LNLALAELLDAVKTAQASKLTTEAIAAGLLQRTADQRGRPPVTAGFDHGWPDLAGWGARIPARLGSARPWQAGPTPSGRLRNPADSVRGRA